MAFSEPLVLVDNSAANQNFTHRGISVLNGADFVEDDSTAGNERYALIRHGSAGPSNAPGSTPKQRHQWAIGQRKYNSLVSKTDVVQINTTFVWDPGTSITTTEFNHLIAMNLSFLTTTNFAKLIRGEV